MMVGPRGWGVGPGVEGVSGTGSVLIYTGAGEGFQMSEVAGRFAALGGTAEDGCPHMASQDYPLRLSGVWGWAGYSG